MRVLIASDKFAGTLTAPEAVDAIAQGWRMADPDVALDLAPLSDGGPGFIDVVHCTLGGEVREVSTCGPHGEPVSARLLLTANRSASTAYVEAADCCGLHLAPVPRRPLAASSVGLSEVLRQAIELGVGIVVVGVGGTASTDGGRGVVEELGRWPEGIELRVATDVDVPLLGPTGAARGFGPQKGASDSDVVVLEERLAAWATTAGLDPDLIGAGAGGGLAYGLMTLGASRVSGAALVADLSALDERIKQADLVITGEGTVDFSSLQGKVVGEVGQRASAAARPCLVLAGRVLVGRREAAAAGLDELSSLADRVGDQAALREAGRELSRLAATVARSWRA